MFEIIPFLNCTSVAQIARISLEMEKTNLYPVNLSTNACMLRIHAKIQTLPTFSLRARNGEEFWLAQREYGQVPGFWWTRYGNFGLRPS